MLSKTLVALVASTTVEFHIGDENEEEEEDEEDESHPLLVREQQQMELRTLSKR